MATATHPVDRKTPPERRISKRIRHACSLLISGEVTTVKAAAERAKLSRTHLSRTLQEPHVRAFVESEMRKNIATAQMRAGSVLASLMDGARSEHVKRDVATYFSELAGFVVQKNASPMITNNIRIMHINGRDEQIVGGYFVDLAPAAERPSAGLAALPIENVATRADILTVPATVPTTNARTK